VPETKPTIGQLIKRYRLLNDIRQEDFASKIEVSRATLINYEKGHTTINVDVLEKIKTAFPDFILDETEEKPKIIENNMIDFKILFDVLRNGRNWIFISTLCFGVMSTGLSFLFTKYYTARISLYPTKQDAASSLGQFQSLASSFGMNIPTENQRFNIPDVVQSNLIKQKIMAQSWRTVSGHNQSLYDLWELYDSPWYGMYSDSPGDSAFINEKAIGYLTKKINVIENRKTGLIEVLVSLEDPAVSASVANFVGVQVQSYIQIENSAQATKEKNFIASRLNIVKNELLDLEDELKSFTERNRGYDESPELFMVYSRLFREVEAKKQVVITLQQQLELARIEEVKQSPILHILDRAEIPARKSAPNRLLFLIAGGFIGLFGSTLITVFRY